MKNFFCELRSALEAGIFLALAILGLVFGLALILACIQGILIVLVGVVDG